MSNPRDTIGFRGEAPLFGPALVLILAVLALALLAHDATRSRTWEAAASTDAPAAVQPAHEAPPSEPVIAW